jgi:hypothetical protein
MSNASYSRLGYFALKAEAVENTALTPDVFVPIMSEDIVTEYQPTPAMPVSQTRVKNLRPVKTAIPAPTGTVTVELEPKTAGHFLRGIYGSMLSGVYLPVTSVVGTFAVGETITGGSSSETAVVVAVSDENDYLLVNTVSGTLTAGETLTGGTSSATAVLTNYVATRYGHQSTTPADSLPTFTVEIGLANEAYRYTGVRFNAISSLGQSDNKITMQVGLVARAEFKHARVLEQVTAGAGAKVIPVDQTLGVVAGDTIKVFRPSTGEYLDFSADDVKTHTAGTVTAGTSIAVTNLETQLEVGDLIVLAPQSATYTISKEFFWIGGSEATIGNTLATATTACIEDFTLTLTNEIEPRHCANGLGIANRFPATNYLKGVEATGSINKTYRDMALLDVLRDNRSQALSIKHTGQQIGSTVGVESLEFRVPNIQFDNFNPSISEDALLEQEINYTAYDGADYFHRAILVNDVATY